MYVSGSYDTGDKISMWTFKSWGHDERPWLPGGRWSLPRPDSKQLSAGTAMPAGYDLGLWLADLQNRCSHIDRIVNLVSVDRANIYPVNRALVSQCCPTMTSVVKVNNFCINSPIEMVRIDVSRTEQSSIRILSTHGCGYGVEFAMISQSVLLWWSVVLHEIRSLLFTYAEMNASCRQINHIYTLSLR